MQMVEGTALMELALGPGWTDGHFIAVVGYRLVAFFIGHSQDSVTTNFLHHVKLLKGGDEFLVMSRNFYGIISSAPKKVHPS